MKSKWRWRIGAALGVAVICIAIVVLQLVPSKKSIDLPTNEVVDSVELFEYAYGSIPDAVTRTTLTSQQVIPELTNAFIDVPVTDFRGNVDELFGKPAVAHRFHITDGQIIEITRVVIGPHDVVIFWPDGSVKKTKWGMPLDGFYDPLGTTETVPGALIPLAE